MSRLEQITAEEHFMEVLKILFAATLTMSPLAANATDLPNDKSHASDPPIEETSHDWSGFYLGGTLGRGWHKAEHCDASGSPACLSAYPHYTAKGMGEGLTFGYNVQSDKFLIGIEGDYSSVSLDGSSNDAFCGGTCESEITSIGTVRARFGYAIDRLLPYVTFGIASARIQASAGINSVPGSDTERSFVFGIGAEYALQKNWSAKFEYLRFDNSEEFGYDSQSYELRLKSSGFAMTRLGLNYRF